MLRVPGTARISNLSKADEAVKCLNQRVGRLDDLYDVVHYRTATGGAATYIDDSTGPFGLNDGEKNRKVAIVGGTGAGQSSRRIVFNSATRINIDSATPFNPAPDATSLYAVYDATEDYRGMILVELTLSGADFTVVLPPEKVFKDAGAYIVVPVWTGVEQTPPGITYIDGASFTLVNSASGNIRLLIYGRK